LQSRENEPQFLYNTACTFAMLGEAEKSLDLLERAVALGYGDRRSGASARPHHIP